MYTEGMENDYRGKRVVVLCVTDEAAMEHENPARARACAGQIGVAKSIYLDGRPCHDEAYLVVMDDGFELNALADELALVK